MNSTEKKILLVEDDDDISGLLDYHISNVGPDFQLDRAKDGAEGLELALRHRYQLVILDIMLPKMNGLDVCRKIRESGDYVPIIMLSAKSEDVDKIVGLELGADDYLAKPFNANELITRIRALLRRVEMDKEKSQQAVPEKPSITEFGPIEIDNSSKQISVDGTALKLTATEYDLLCYLIENAGTVLSREQIAKQVLGYTTATSDWSVNTHVNRLRRKLEPNQDESSYIITVRGFGYRFISEEEISEGATTDG